MALGSDTASGNLAVPASQPWAPSASGPQATSSSPANDPNEKKLLAECPQRYQALP